MVLLVQVHALVITFACRGISALNVDTDFPIIFEPPEFARKDTESYFGFSVGIVNEQDIVSFLVGAPNATSQNFRGRPPNTGSIYLCYLTLDTDRAQCEEVNLSEDNGNTVDWRDYKINNTMASRSCLGISVEVSPSTIGRPQKVVTCASSWANYQPGVEPRLTPSGKCYVFSVGNNVTQITNQLFPLSRSSDQFERRKNSLARIAAYSNTGISIAFTKRTGELFMGAPGYKDWKGTIVAYITENLIRNKYYGLGTEFSWDNLRLSQNEYFGYSIVSIIRGNSDLALVGAPRARAAGQLYGGTFGSVYTVPSPRVGVSDLKKISTGKSFENFGAAVLAVDINGDGEEDIVVGAPFYSKEIRFRGDQGRIQVTVRGLHQEIVGSKPGGRFGTSLASLGDIDLDGFNDIVVGAPFEDDRGAVYIFRGSQNGLIEEPYQVITASQLLNSSSSLKGFGVSVKTMDVDGNGHPDLFVGSYLSANAVLLRSKPIATIVASLESSVSLIDVSAPTRDCGVNGHCIPLQYCLDIKGQHLNEFLEVNITIEMDPQLRESGYNSRGYFLKNEGQTILETKVQIPTNKRTCTKDVFVFLMPRVEEQLRSLELKLSYDLSHERFTKSSTVFCNNCPVLVDKNSVQKFIPFATGCGRDGKCTSRIITRISTLINDSASNQLIYGRDKVINLEVEITKENENAHNVKLYIRTQPLLNPLKLDDCSYEKATDGLRVIVCRVGNPLTEPKRTVQIPFDVSSLSGHLSQIVFTANVTIANELVKNSVTNVTHTVDIRKIARVDISSTRIHTFSYDHQKLRSLDHVNFFTIIQVIKSKPSPVDAIEVSLHIPAVVNGEAVLYQPIIKAIPETFRMTCEPQSDVTLPQLPTNDQSDGQPSISGNQVTRHRRQLATANEANFTVNGNFSVENFISLNCTELLCIEIKCTIGPFSQRNVAFINLTSAINLTRIEQDFGTKPNGMHMTINLNAKILDDVIISDDIKSHSNSTIILRQLPYAEPASLIVLAMSSGIGILLVILLLILLIKIGFFKRHKKDELQKLINEHSGNEMQSQATSTEADAEL